MHYNNAKGIILYERKKHNRKVPYTFAEGNQMLLNDKEYQGIYKGYIKASDVSGALIFSSDDLIKALNEEEEIFYDETFEV